MNSTTQINKNYKAIDFLKNREAQSNKRLLGLAVFVVLVNILIHFELWYYQIWTPYALVSLLLFLFIWLKLQNEHHVIISKKTKQIKKLLSSKFSISDYYANICIEQNDFINSRFYDNLTFNYEGNNLMVGENWAASNIYVSQNLTKSKEIITVFDGIFAKFNSRSFVDGLLIIKPTTIPDKADIPEVLQNLIHRYFTPEVDGSATGNFEFDSKFEIFSNPPALQTKLLSSKMIQNILVIEEKLTHDFNIVSNCSSNKMIKPALEISFIQNHIYVGVRGLKLFIDINNSSSEIYKAQKCLEIIKLISKINKT